MEFRQLTSSDEKQYCKLLKWNFGADTTTPFWKYLFSHPEYWTNIYGWVDEGILVSIWNQILIDTVIRGKKVQSYFIEDAITNPDYRNRGLIKKAFLANCEVAKKEKVDFILLTPFKHGYYAKFGFASAFNRFRLKTPMSLISSTESDGNFCVRAGELKENPEIRADFYHLLDIYWENSMYNEKRYPDYWEKHMDYIKDQRIAIVYEPTSSERKTPLGFLVYREKERELVVLGFRYHSFGAFLALKNYIRAHKDQVDSVHCTSIPEDFPIEAFIHSYWTGKKQAVFSYEPSKMLRVVSPRTALENFIATSPENPIRLSITDPLLTENSGIYTLTVNGGVQFHETGKFDLEISIEALAQLITGRFSAFDLYDTNEITLPEDNSEMSYLNKEYPPILAYLDALYPKTLTFYPEFD